MFWAGPPGKKPQGRPTSWRDYYIDPSSLEHISRKKWMDRSIAAFSVGFYKGFGATVGPTQVSKERSKSVTGING